MRSGTRCPNTREAEQPANAYRAGFLVDLTTPALCTARTQCAQRASFDRVSTAAWTTLKH